MTKYKLNQVSIRMVRERPLLSEAPFNSPVSAVKVMNELLKDYDREVLAVVNLQNDMKPINMNIVSIGTLTASVAHPREILKSVVLSNAASVILIHSSPRGSCPRGEETSSSSC